MCKGKTSVETQERQGEEEAEAGAMHLQAQGSQEPPAVPGSRKGEEEGLPESPPREPGPAHTCIRAIWPAEW